MRAFVTDHQPRMDAVGADRVMSLIQSVVPLGTAVLLCYEALDGVPVKDWPYTCHRRALAVRLEMETGQPVPEMTGDLVLPYPP